MDYVFFIGEANLTKVLRLANTIMMPGLRVKTGLTKINKAGVSFSVFQVLANAYGNKGFPISL